MARILATITRALRLDQHEAPVHFHTGGFWRDEQPEVCFDPDCPRPRARVG